MNQHLINVIGLLLLFILLIEIIWIFDHTTTDGKEADKLK